MFIIKCANTLSPNCISLYVHLGIVVHPQGTVVLSNVYRNSVNTEKDAALEVGTNRFQYSRMLVFGY